MTLPMLERQLHALTEEYYEEVSQYIEFLMVRQEHRKKSGPSPVDISYFGSLKNLPAGMDIQRSERNEWN